MALLSEGQKHVIRTMAAQNPDTESCGFIMEDGGLIMLPNIAHDQAGEFAIDPRDYAKWEPLGIAGVWHSHIELDGFSPLDQTVMRSDSLPWAIYCLRTDKFHECDPNWTAPYVGRPFVYGIFDCYSLVSDYLAHEHQVHLPLWDRGEYGEWNQPGFNPFDEEWAGIGKRVPSYSPLQDGDILLMNLGDHRGHTDHIGVINEDLRLLHHLAEKESRVDVMGGAWQRALRLAVRPNELA